MKEERKRNKNGKEKRKTTIWKHMRGEKTIEGSERMNVMRQALVSYTCTGGMSEVSGKPPTDRRAARTVLQFSQRGWLYCHLAFTSVWRNCKTTHFCYFKQYPL